MTRKIIHISAVTGGANRTETVYALCDDGSVWRLLVTPVGVGSWQQIPEMPQ